MFTLISIMLKTCCCDTAIVLWLCTKGFIFWKKDGKSWARSMGFGPGPAIQIIEASFMTPKNLLV